MNEKKDMLVFENAEFGQVRTVTINGEPWFVGKDVAKALGYVKTENAISVHVLSEDKTTTLIQGSGSNYKSKTVIINESGLYALIFGSKLPSAMGFKRWVTSEVLPSIRKHGAYMTPETLTEALVNPDAVIQMLTALAQEQQKRIALEADNAALTAENTIMAPKVEYYDELVERDALTNFRDTAKELGIGEKVFIKWLLDKKYIYRDSRRKLKPYAKAKAAGLFAIKDFCSGGHTGSQTLITTEGKNKFRMMIQQEDFAKIS